MTYKSKKVPTAGVLEPSRHFESEYRLVVARSLVNLCNTEVIPVRILNPYSEEVRLHINTIVGHLEFAEEPLASISVEPVVISDKIQSGDCCTARITGSTENCCPHNNQLQVPEINNTFHNVPAHLQELYERSCQNL